MGSVGGGEGIVCGVSAFFRQALSCLHFIGLGLKD